MEADGPPTQLLINNKVESLAGGERGVRDGVSYNTLPFLCIPDIFCSHQVVTLSSFQEKAANAASAGYTDNVYTLKLQLSLPTSLLKSVVILLHSN